MLALADVAVVVSNADATAQWWQKNFGFAVHHVNDGDHAVMVAPPGDRFVIHLCQGFAPLEPGDSGIAFITDEIETLVPKLLASGVLFPEPLQTESWGGMAKFADPDGNIFWLMGVPRAFVARTQRLFAPGGASRPPKKPTRAEPTRKASRVGPGRRTRARRGRPSRRSK
jgi:catechol 2,3-dioxygenase-like lactoylglutathione lyase family enzyme